MDFTSIVVLVIVVVALIWLLMRLRGGVRNPPKLRVAMELISNINDDLKIITQKQADPTIIKKFKTGNWKSFQDHIDFLEKDTIEALKLSFDQMVAYNSKLIEAASKGIPYQDPPEFSLDPLKENLAKARVGLAKWIRENINRESTRGMFSWR